MGLSCSVLVGGFFFGGFGFACFLWGSYRELAPPSDTAFAYE